MRVRPSALDRLLRPLHRWVWHDPHRRALKLLRFAETEADGGRDLSRAAELTHDALLRRLYLRHSQDEQRHAELFRVRGRAMLAQLADAARNGESPAPNQANWLAPGERGLDDLRVDAEAEDSLLAFLHLSEKAAAARFSLYQQVLAHDPATQDIFRDILEDEAFHMSYTQKQLARVSPQKHGLRLWQARLGRVWRSYLRLATALAAILGTLMLRLQYFIVLPVFALLAKRAARREPEGFVPARRIVNLEDQY
jgi:rubrerythrin